MKRMILVTLCGLLSFGCAHTSIKSVSPETYRADFLDEFKSAAPLANQNYVFTVGTLEDKTGKFMDGDQLRYSRTVTQAARDLVGHFILAGGFKVVERDPYNIQLITQEYKMSHTYVFGKDGKVMEQAGLIKRKGPSEGLTGATHLVTGAITTYQVSRYSGGGGLEVDAIGINVTFVRSVVGLQLRIINLATSEVICSTLELAKVEGTKIGFNAFKLITNSGNVTIVSAEAGLAQQFPADFALSEAMISGLCRLLTAKGTDFYSKKMDFKNLYQAGEIPKEKTKVSETPIAPPVKEASVPVKVAEPIKATPMSKPTTNVKEVVVKPKTQVTDTSNLFRCISTGSYTAPADCSK